MDMNEDPLAPARGLVWGLILSIPFWVFVLILIF
jgi:hypothetical protein